MKLHQHIRREQARHTDDWLITYADTVTLLLCLFVIMLSIKANSHSLARDQAAPVQQLAASEDIVPRTCIAPEAGEAVGATSPDFVSPIPAFEEAPPDSVIAVPTPMPDAPGRLDAAVAAPTNLMEGTPLRGSGLASLPAIVDRLQSQGTPAVAQQGDRITILQISSAAFFGSGYAALSGAGKAILRDVAVTLKSDAYAGITSPSRDIPTMRQSTRRNFNPTGNCRRRARRLWCVSFWSKASRRGNSLPPAMPIRFPSRQIGHLTGRSSRKTRPGTGVW
jgi:hypothetical protein